MRKMTYHDRVMIEAYVKAKMRVYEIAELTGFSPKSIYLELRKGAVKLLSSDLVFYTSYSADKAQQETEWRKGAHSPGLKIGSDHESAARIDELISQKYSPYAVSRILKAEGKISLSKSTIYKYIYDGVVMSSGKDLISGPRSRKKKEPPKENIKRMGRSISDRPKSVLDRDEFGHWEMDTVQPSQGNSACFLVLTERLSRYEIVRKLPSKESSHPIKELRRLRRDFGPRFKEFFHTITPDNGSEFSQAPRIESKHLQVYFCHPGSPGERGSNENCNRFIRRWYPKGSSFEEVTTEEVQELQDWINTYPRPMFGGLSAADIADAFDFRDVRAKRLT